MLKDWFNKRTLSCYWLVNSHLYKEAMKSNNGIGFKDALVLFNGKPFEQVMDFTPWLIPVSDDVKALPSSILNQGIGIEADAATIPLLIHLQSLLLAGLDGEEILFRFYDIKVIAPMLNDMEQGEVEQFLGNISSMAFLVNKQLNTYSNKNVTRYQYQNRPWWRIKQHHLQHLYHVENHARSLERYWWEKIPEVMETLTDSSVLILQFLQQGNHRYFNEDKAELYTLHKILKLSDVSLNQIKQMLWLDAKDVTFMTNIQEQES